MHAKTEQIQTVLVQQAISFKLAHRIWKEGTIYIVTTEENFVIWLLK